MKSVFRARCVVAFVIGFLVAGWHQVAQADWGIFDAGIFLDINDGGMAYQNASGFDGSHIGDFKSGEGDSLVLLGGEAKTWKDGGSDVTGAMFHYAVYPVDGTPNTFTTINLPFSSNDGGGDQTWNTALESIDLLDTVTRPGTYRIAFYVSASGTNPTETKFYSNMGNNFIATFNYNIPELTVNEVNANYTTSNFFVNEVEGDSFPIHVVFRPNARADIAEVEVFSNLNRRDWATAVWTNAHGVVTHEGIQPRPGNSILAHHTNYYHRAYPMDTVIPNEEYSLTLDVEKTGMYRLTARYRVVGDTNWYWYTDTGMGRRDHAIVVSPSTARDIVMYEVNTFNIKATGTLESQRSTFVDLWDGPGSDTNKPPWNLQYLQDLGVNMLWFQPVHPYGVDGRHLSAADINNRDPSAGADTWIWNGGSPYQDVNYPYALGSPYAVKNFWEIEPRMSRDNTREAAMAEFTNFVQAASDAGVGVMLDAAFNHTAFDVELGELGVELFAPGQSPTAEIRDHEARFFSRAGNYAQRASSAGDIAVAPDRLFGNPPSQGAWFDTFDVFFGRYASLVATPNDTTAHLDESDWFDYTHGSPGYFDQITHNVWKYFGAYVPYWLERTGYTANTPPDAIHVGIDGLRCDFAQGLPPQAWEYIINRARAVKWNFVFMAESLDGGPVTYRSSRHFDILNESIVFALENASTTSGFRDVFESRRSAYGEGLVLLNTTSHDEKNYEDPWEALLRFAVNSTIDGAPMIFPGQELGISEFFGYDLMERNVGKWIPHFKTFNSMMPLWNQWLNEENFGNLQLFPVYEGINRARNQSPALRSSNRWFLNAHSGGAPDENIFAVAKYETESASPAVSDVVLGFVNVDRNNPRSNTFGIPSDLADRLGLSAGRQYNVRNLAAHTGLVSGRDEQWLWGSGRDRNDIISSGVYVSLHGVPSSEMDWYDYPYEAQFLKVYDVTAPPGLVTAPAHETELHYAIGDTATFTWDEVIDPEGAPVMYAVIIDDGSTVTTNFTTDTSYAVTGAFGQEIAVTVQPVNPHQTANAGGPSPESQTVQLLDPDVSHDGTGIPAWKQDIAGTDPLDPNSLFAIESAVRSMATGNNEITFMAQPGRTYTLYYSDDSLASGNMTWNEVGTYTTVGSEPTGHTFSHSPSATGTRFYRLEVERD